MRRGLSLYIPSSHGWGVRAVARTPFLVPCVPAATVLLTTQRAAPHRAPARFLCGPARRATLADDPPDPTHTEQHLDGDLSLTVRARVAEPATGVRARALWTPQRRLVDHQPAPVVGPVTPPAGVVPRRFSRRTSPLRYAPALHWSAPSTHPADGAPRGSYDAADDRGSWGPVYGGGSLPSVISPWRPETPRADVCSSPGTPQRLS